MTDDMWMLVGVLWFSIFVAGVFVGIVITLWRKPNHLYVHKVDPPKPNQYGNFEPLPSKEVFDPTQPPPFSIGGSAGEKLAGRLATDEHGVIGPKPEDTFLRPKSENQ